MQRIIHRSELQLRTPKSSEATATKKIPGYFPGSNK